MNMFSLNIIIVFLIWRNFFEMPAILLFPPSSQLHSQVLIEAFKFPSCIDSIILAKKCNLTDICNFIFSFTLSTLQYENINMQNTPEHSSSIVNM